MKRGANAATGRKRLTGRTPRVVATVIEVDESSLGDETHFIEDLGVGSLVALEVAVNLEQKYRVRIFRGGVGARRPACGTSTSFCWRREPVTQVGELMPGDGSA